MALTPKSKLATRRIALNAPAIPSPSPSAIRIPISDERRVTEYDITA
jgi:hypothetical protein